MFVIRIMRKNILFFHKVKESFMYLHSLQRQTCPISAEFPTLRALWHFPRLKHDFMFL